MMVIRPVVVGGAYSTVAGSAHRTPNVLGVLYCVPRRNEDVYVIRQRQYKCWSRMNRPIFLWRVCSYSSAQCQCAHNESVPLLRSRPAYRDDDDDDDDDDGFFGNERGMSYCLIDVVQKCLCYRCNSGSRPLAREPIHAVGAGKAGEPGLAFSLSRI
jgi:hypothetical protein